MGEKTPDTDSSGIERRDVLKGLGFGAVGLAGAGAATSATAQQGQTPGAGNVTIDYVKVVPEAAEPEVNQTTYVDRPWATADLIFGLDFEGENAKDVLDGPIPVGYQFVVVDQQTRQPVTESFDEGRCACFAGNVDVSPGGGTTGRKTFSLSGLGPDQPNQQPNQYIAALTVTEYRGDLDPVLGAYEFTVEDQPPDENGGDGNQTTTTTTQDGGDAGGAGDGGGDDAGGAGDAGTTTTTTTQDGNGGNGGNGNGGNGNNSATGPLI